MDYEEFNFLDGSDKAYAQGEKPITYWHKKTILAYVNYYLDTYKKTPEGAKAYGKLMRDMNLTDLEIKGQIKKTTLNLLQRNLLEKTDVHLTGSFYMDKLRHTRFFKVVRDKVLLARLRRYILQPKVYEQLKIRGM